MKTMWMVAALGLCACASDPHEEMRADANQVDSLAHELAQETQEYCAGAPWAAPASCADALASHGAVAGARIESLMQHAERMDGYLESVGAGALADVVCGVPALGAEMERHAGVACAGDAAAAETEARGHCAAVMDVAAQLHARANMVLRATRESVLVGRSGRMPGHLQPLPTGEHAWPWAAETEPVAAALCGG